MQTGDAAANAAGAFAGGLNHGGDEGVIVLTLGGLATTISNVINGSPERSIVATPAARRRAVVWLPRIFYSPPTSAVTTPRSPVSLPACPAYRPRPPNSGSISRAG